MSWLWCACGSRHWGSRGAAGVLVIDDDRVLLQLRSAFVQQGGTWSIPGGAIDRGESAVDAALREAAEECRIRRQDLHRIGEHIDRCVAGWSYTTVLARAVRTITTTSNGEADRCEFVALDDVGRLDLHPSFRRAWPRLRELVEGASRSPKPVETEHCTGSLPSLPRGVPPVARACAREEER